jgi:hypothetical protein
VRNSISSCLLFFQGIMAIVVLSTRARQRLGARIRFSTCWQTLLSFPSFSLGSRLLYVRRLEPMRVHVFLFAIIEPNEVTRADNVARNRSSAHSETSGAILIISTAHTVTAHELAIRTYRRRCVHHASRLIPAAEFVNLGSAVEFGALVENLSLPARLVRLYQAARQNFPDAYDEFNVGWDAESKPPQIRYHQQPCGRPVRPSG